MADRKIFLPKQHVRRGHAGYKGDPNQVVVVDTDTGKAVPHALENNRKKRRG